jgi:uncharacterized protein (TIGR02118 family)
MIKLFELWTRRSDMTHEEAIRHWTEVHAPLVKKTFGEKIIKYVTNVGLPLDTRGWSRNEAPPYDGIAEFWIDMTVEELDQAIRETAHILWPDEQAFIGTYRTMLVEEIVQKAGSTTRERRD